MLKSTESQAQRCIKTKGLGNLEISAQFPLFPLPRAGQLHVCALPACCLRLTLRLFAASEPNLKVRLALKQKMIERRSTTLLRRKERFTLNAKRTSTPLTSECNV